MNDSVGSSYVNGDAGAVIHTPRAEVTINQICPGPATCPHRVPIGVPDAKEENEFYKDTGIRCGPQARRLLIELQARHGLRWRGAGSISKMWRHNTVEYLDGHDTLRINPSWTWTIYGWVLFACGALMMVSGITLMPSTMSTALGGIGNSIFIVGLGLFLAWVSTESMIIPNSAARRLLKKERDQACKGAVQNVRRAFG